jgi:hypothetical protein
MIIANAMNACAQAAERCRPDVAAHLGQIEAGLALGAEPAATVAPYVQSSVYACLLPRLDMMKSLGLVWIPRRDGRHGTVWCEPTLCRHLSIYHCRHDSSRLRHHRNVGDSAYASMCVFQLIFRHEEPSKLLSAKV